MKTIIRLLTEILSELRHIRCSLEKQNTPDVQDRECLMGNDCDVHSSYEQFIAAMKKNQSSSTMAADKTS